MKTLLSILASGILLLNSCQDPNVIAQEFTTPPTITSDSIAVEQIMRPSGFFASKDRVVVSTLEDPLYNVYSLPDFKFMYSYGKNGAGPDELNAPDTNPTSDEDVISVRTYNGSGNTVSLFRVGKDSFEKISSRVDYGFNRNYKSIFRIISDTLLISSHIDSEKDRDHTLLLRSSNTGEYKNIAPLFYQYTIPFDERPNISRNIAYATVNERRIAIAYQESQHIDIYNISSNDEFKYITTIGTPLSKAQLSTDPRLSKVTYIQILSDSKYIYAINAHTDTPALMTQTPIYFYVEIYNWNGDKVNAFKLDRENVMPVFISQKDRTMFAFNPKADFEQIFTYKLP